MNPGFLEFLSASPEDRRDVFLGTARRLGTPEQNVEKDFWVTAQLPHRQLAIAGLTRPTGFGRVGSALNPSLETDVEFRSRPRR